MSEKGEIQVDTVWTRAEHKRRMTRLGSVLLLVLAPMAAGMATVLELDGAMTFGAALLICAAGMFSFGVRTAPRILAGRALQYRGSELRIGDAQSERTVAVSELAAGWLTSDGLALQTRNGELVEAEGVDPQRAAQLLGDLRLGAGQRTVRFPLASLASSRRSSITAWTLLGATLLLPFVLLGLFAIGAALTEVLVGGIQTTRALSSLGMGAIPPLLLYALWRNHQRRYVAVGADGVSIDQYWGKRFVPMSLVSRVQGRYPDFGLLLTDGERIPLPGVEGSVPLAQRVADAKALSQEVELRIDLSELERGDREQAAWQQAISKRASGAGSYRDAGWEADDLADIATSPTCSPEQRIAAALGVAASGDGPARARVRIAAAACIDRDLRVALEEAAEGELSGRRMKRATARHRSI